MKYFSIVFQPCSLLASQFVHDVKQVAWISKHPLFFLTYWPHHVCVHDGKILHKRQPIRRPEQANEGAQRQLQYNKIT